MRVIYTTLAIGILIFVSACHHGKPTVESTDGAASQPAPRPVSNRY